MNKLCSNTEIHDDMCVIFRRKKYKLGDVIKICRAGESIEGIHPFQYNKLLYRFEKERHKKYQYSVDDRYGEWRFILFDGGGDDTNTNHKTKTINKTNTNHKTIGVGVVRPKELPIYNFL